MSNAKPTKKKLLKPGSTKSSRQRQQLSLEKRLEVLSLVPTEILDLVFTYLSPSDLLRCCCVCKEWNKIASSSVLWEQHFKNLPLKTQTLSKLAKTCQQIDWKTEVIKCCLLWRKKVIKKLSAKMKWLEMVKWEVTLRSRNKNISHKIISSDQYIYPHGFTVRWNSLNDVGLQEVTSLKLHALVPVFLTDEGDPVKYSVCTRSLIMSEEFKSNKISTKLKKICSDEENTTIYQCGMIYFGIWNSSVKTTFDIAFILYTSTFDHIKEKILNSTSERIYSIPKHVAVQDDVDKRYGYHGYSVSVTLRSSRKLYWMENYLLKDGWRSGNEIVIEYERPSDYNFYDSEGSFEFTWKSNFLKGAIKDVVIADIILTDYNGDKPWSFGFLCQLKGIACEKDNYNYENYEVIGAEYDGDNNKRFHIHLIKNPIAIKWCIKKLRFYLSEQFINEWFGTNH